MPLIHSVPPYPGLGSPRKAGWRLSLFCHMRPAVTEGYVNGLTCEPNVPPTALTEARSGSQKYGPVRRPSPSSKKWPVLNAAPPKVTNRSLRGKNSELS